MVDLRRKSVKTLPAYLDNASEFRFFVYQLTASKLFGGLILFIILLNTAILFVQTDEQIRVLGGWYFVVVDNAFLGVYIMEMALKLYAMRIAYFKSGWNVLDAVIVIFTTADFVLSIVVQDGSVSIGGDSFGLFRVIRIFKSVRALRALKVLRTIRFLKNLQVVLATILKSIRALSTILMLVGLFMYIFAVVGTELFKETVTEFESIYKTFITLFQVMTMDDWSEIYEKAKEDEIKNNQSNTMSAILLVYMTAFIILENLVFLNLFAAVLVDNFQRTLMAAEAKRKLSTAIKNRTVFTKEEENTAAEYDFESDSENDSIGNDEQAEEGEAEMHPIEFYFSEKAVPEEKDRQLMKGYFQYLATLEYNLHHMQVQQQVLDELIDAAITIPDVPEEVM